MYFVIFCAALVVTAYLFYDKVTAAPKPNAQNSGLTNHVEVQGSVDRLQVDRDELGYNDGGYDTVDDKVDDAVDDKVDDTVDEEHPSADAETIVEPRNTGVTGEMHGRLSYLKDSFHRGVGYIGNRIMDGYRQFGKGENIKNQDDTTELDNKPSSVEPRETLDSVEEEVDEQKQTDSNVQDSSAHQNDTCQEKNSKQHLRIRRGSDGRHHTILKTEDGQKLQQEDDENPDLNNDTLTDQTGSLNPSMRDGTHESAMLDHGGYDVFLSRKNGVFGEGEQQGDTTSDAPIEAMEIDDGTVSAPPEYSEENRPELRNRAKKNRRLTTTVNRSDIPSNPTN